jgi:Ca-activated chloride channel family protein
MRFGSPAALHLYWLVLGLLLLQVYARRAKRRDLGRFGHLPTVRKLVASASAALQVLKSTLFLVAVALLVFCLARPQWGARLEQVRRRGVDVIVALDTSLSMLAEDLKPNRLVRAKGEVASFLDKLGGDRVGLVAFAGTAFVQCPLTMDYGAAKLFLSAMDENLLPKPGTALAEAIRAAAKAFPKGERKHKVLVLITDGEDFGDDPIAAAKEAREQGVLIFAIGIGAGSGQPIPLRDARGNLKGYKKDRDGRVVTTRLNESVLERIALSGDGKYFRASAGELELSRIAEEISKMEKRELSSQLYSQYEDRYQVFLPLPLALLLVEATLSDRKRRRETWRGRFA